MALIQKTQKTTETGGWPGKIPLSYLYTAGRGGEEFFRKLKDSGKFVGSRCKSCGKVYVPVTIYCESCFQKTEGRSVPVKSRGTVHTFTVCSETYDEKRKKTPSIVAAIQLEGTDSVFLHWLGEIDPEDCEIGMEVEAVFKPKNARKGSILDIKHFRPR